MTSGALEPSSYIVSKKTVFSTSFMQFRYKNIVELMKFKIISVFWRSVVIARIVLLSELGI